MDFSLCQYFMKNLSVRDSSFLSRADATRPNRFPLRPPQRQHDARRCFFPIRSLPEVLQRVLLSTEAADRFLDRRAGSEDGLSLLQHALLGRHETIASGHETRRVIPRHAEGDDGDGDCGESESGYPERSERKAGSVRRLLRPTLPAVAEQGDLLPSRAARAERDLQHAAEAQSGLSGAVLGTTVARCSRRRWRTERSIWIACSRQTRMCFRMRKSTRVSSR